MVARRPCEALASSNYKDQFERVRLAVLGQVVRDLDTCPGRARRFSWTRPVAHVGR
jgi:hypothetical protein